MDLQIETEEAEVDEEADVADVVDEAVEDEEEVSVGRKEGCLPLLFFLAYPSLSTYVIYENRRLFSVK